MDQSGTGGPLGMSKSMGHGDHFGTDGSLVIRVDHLDIGEPPGHRYIKRESPRHRCITWKRSGHQDINGTVFHQDTSRTQWYGRITGIRASYGEQVHREDCLVQSLRLERVRAVRTRDISAPAGSDALRQLTPHSLAVVPSLFNRVLPS